MMSKHYVAITPPSPPRPKFHRYVSTVCVWVSMPTYCRICIFILRYTRARDRVRTPGRVYTRQISSPVPSINQSPYYVVHRFGFIANPSVNYAFPSVFQCRVDRLHPIGGPLSPHQATSTSKFPAGAHAPPLRRGRGAICDLREIGPF